MKPLIRLFAAAMAASFLLAPAAMADRGRGKGYDRGYDRGYERHHGRDHRSRGRSYERHYSHSRNHKPQRRTYYAPPRTVVVHRPP
ncbi:MAG: hypothetical protein ACK4P2_09600, partial [Hyphomonas sp.]